jgi:putative nucleotidyltransferase with HDIG domain
VGSPEKRIEEDPIRILRGLRFAARFGFFLDPDTRNAMLSKKMRVTHVPRERIRLELMKILKECDRPSDFFDFLRELGLLKWILPSLSETVGKRGGNHHGEDVYDHCVMASNHLPKEKPLLRLAGLLHDVGKPRTSRVDEHSGISFHAHEAVGAEMANDDLRFLRFSVKETEYVTSLIRFHMWNFEEDSKVNTYRRWMSKLARHGIDVQDLLDLRVADRKANLKKAGKPVKTYEFRRTIKMIEKVIEEDSALKLSDMEFNGHDLIAMGLKPSPKFGVILNALFERILDDPKLNTREKLKELAREMI